MPTLAFLIAKGFHLPPEIVPATLKRQARTDARSRPSQPPSSGGFGGDKMDSDRSAYRRAPGAANGADKAGAAGPGSAPMEFVSDTFLLKKLIGFNFWLCSFEKGHICFDSTMS